MAQSKKVKKAPKVKKSPIKPALHVRTLTAEGWKRRMTKVK